MGSFDRAELSRDETIRWIESILNDFEIILILEHLELSLALISIQLGIPTDDLVYHAVNIQSQKTNEKELLNQDSKVNLKRLNWPDYMLYQVRAPQTPRKNHPTAGIMRTFDGDCPLSPDKGSKCNIV